MIISDLVSTLIIKSDTGGKEVKKLTIILTVCFLSIIVLVFMPALGIAKDQKSVHEIRSVVIIKEKPPEPPKIHKFLSLEGLLTTLKVVYPHPHWGKAYFKASFGGLPLGRNMETAIIETVPEHIKMTEQMDANGESYFFKSRIFTKYQIFGVDVYNNNDKEWDKKKLSARIKIFIEPHFELSLQKRKDLAQLIKKSINASTPLLFEADYYSIEKIEKMDLSGNIDIVFQITDAQMIK